MWQKDSLCLSSKGLAFDLPAIMAGFVFLLLFSLHFVHACKLIEIYEAGNSLV